MIAPIASRNASTDCSMWRARCSRAAESCETCEARLRLRPIASWNIFDGACQRADLVGAARVRHHDILGAVGDLLDGRGDRGEWTGDRAGDDDDADHDEGQRDAAEAGQHEGQGAVGLGLVRDLPGALGIDLGQRLEILVQRRAHGAIGVVVAPFAARGRIDLDAAAHQLLAEVDELLDALLEGGELLGIVGLDDGLPALSRHSRICSLNLSRPSPYFFTTAGSVDM